MSGSSPAKTWALIRPYARKHLGVLALVFGLGVVVALAEAKGCTLQALDLDAMRSVDPRISEAVFAVLAPEHSVRSRRSYGGTAPDTVREAIERAKGRWLSGKPIQG